MWSYWWIPVLVVEFVVVAWFSIKNNEATGPGAWKDFVLLWSFGLIPIWPIIAKYSKSLVFDGLLYDLLVVVTYTIATLYFTKTLGRLGPTEYAGLGLMVLGLFLFKRAV